MKLPEKISSIEHGYENLSVRQQCEILGLNRSSLYYPAQVISQEKLYHYNMIDEIFTKYPFLGYRRVTLALRDYGIFLNKKTVYAYMQRMGLRSISPGPHTSVAHPAHKIYPYLLRGLPITKPMQVWGTDLTYIRMQHGFLYLVAIIDWYSRFVVSWRLSTSLSADFCIDAMRDALNTGRPEIVNMDQGSQFTCLEFTEVLKDAGVKISMDGKGSFWDNIFTERFWRTIKCEEVYPKEYIDFTHALKSITAYIHYYNYQRHHSMLANFQPHLIHFNRLMAIPDLSIIIS